jgi:hypothetical protein
MEIPQEKKLKKLPSYGKAACGTITSKQKG